MIVVCYLLSAILIVLLVYVVFSWIPRPPEPLLPLVRAIDRAVSPVLEPIRRALPPLRIGGMGLDLSVIVVWLVILVFQRLFC